MKMMLLCASKQPDWPRSEDIKRVECTNYEWASKYDHETDEGKKNRIREAKGTEMMPRKNKKGKTMIESLVQRNEGMAQE